jgi:hypothetical protein
MGYIMVSEHFIGILPEENSNTSVYHRSGKEENKVVC